MKWIIIAYLLIGVFFIAVVEAATRTETTATSLLLSVFWPMVLAILIVFGVINFVYAAGTKIGKWIGDKYYDRM